MERLINGCALVTVAFVLFFTFGLGAVTAVVLINIGDIF